MSEYQNNDMGRELDWDDAIENESSGWVLLPEGEYPFEIVSMERGRYQGSAKLPPCKMLTVTAQIDGGTNGSTTIEHRLYLHTKTEGLLSAFFIAIGQKKPGEPLKPDWGAIIGAKGRCVVEINKYTKKTVRRANRTESKNSLRRRFRQQADGNRGLSK